MMDVFYIEFRKKDELTTNDPLVDRGGHWELQHNGVRP